MNRIAVVTGASSGFGLLISVELAKNGFDVLATMRNLGKSNVFSMITNDADVLNRIQPFQLDVTNSESIERFKEKLDLMDQIAVLVNNAGFAVGGFAEEIELDTYRKQFETNVFGVMAVTQAVLPKMRDQGSGTIINMSSISGQVGFPGLSPYVSSKYALEGYTESLRLELVPFGIQVALVEPGSYQTNIWKRGIEASIESMKENSAYTNFMQKLTSQLDENQDKHGDPIDVARLVTNLARKPKLKKLRYPIGKGVKLSIFMKKIIPWYYFEKMIQKSLK